VWFSSFFSISLLVFHKNPIFEEIANQAHWELEKNFHYNLKIRILELIFTLSILHLQGLGGKNFIIEAQSEWLKREMQLFLMSPNRAHFVY